jgi:hypothetical protein
MHVSGRGMVEWVQRYACANLSEIFGWQGGEFFTGATLYFRINFRINTWFKTVFQVVHPRLKSQQQQSFLF